MQGRRYLIGPKRRLFLAARGAVAFGFGLWLFLALFGRPSLTPLWIPFFAAVMFITEFQRLHIWRAFRLFRRRAQLRDRRLLHRG